MHVVATAGHVDHGKSTLVRALTGTDPDRLADERRRGLSIELGYAWTDLSPVGDVAFVDVPGHQRFLTTALAGLGPVPVALLVVAADDPWMPQAAEHLAALDALGVRHGLVAVTRSDLADPAPALARAREQLARTTLRDAGAVAVSAVTGAGMEALRTALGRLLARVPGPDPAADVRLWVDRRFTVRGTGTVVTGTLPAGTLRVGDRLAVADDVVRVRGLEALGRTETQVSGVARVAVDLGGRVPESLTRGTALVTPDAFDAVHTVDVELSGDTGPGQQPLLHVGSAMTAVHFRPLADGLARLTLDAALPLRLGDRALLREPGSRELWGVRVLDVSPPPLNRRGAAAARARALTGSGPDLADQLRLRGLVRRSALRRLGVPDGPPPDGTVQAADWLVSPELARRLGDELARLVETASAASRPGVPVAAAAQALELPDPALVAALLRPPLRLVQGRVVGAAAAVLPSRQQAAVDALRAELAAAPFRAPDADRLRQLGLDPRTVAALHHGGHLLRVADGIVLLPGADDEAVEVLRTLPEPFTTSRAREALGTSRRVALPLLAHLDRTGRTVRLADDRRRLRGPHPTG